MSAAAQSSRVRDNGESLQDPVLTAIWQTGVALCAVIVVPVAGRRSAPTACSPGQRGSARLVLLSDITAQRRASVVTLSNPD